MAEEERLLGEERGKDVPLKGESSHSRNLMLGDSMYSKLDALLSQTQLYSEFLLEKMDNIKLASAKATKAPRFALSDIEEDIAIKGEKFLTENEIIVKAQDELIPLLTGGTLKSYQLKGVKWLISLWQNGLNGILADQMGLGKTIQAIGLLAHLKGKGMHGPFLVCAPLSTLSNWVNEIKRGLIYLNYVENVATPVATSQGRFTRWAPTLPVLLYHGTKNERGEMRMSMSATMSPEFPIIVTSYEVAIHDRKYLCRRKWKYVIVDEGHRLKNSDCKLIRELKMIPTENALLLTGTPLQNNLSELWSLLNFILPEIFTSLQQFESWFDLSGKQSHGLNREEIDEQQRIKVITKLHSILRPFLLRRVKEEVEKSLPLKKEIIFYTPMTKDQEEFQNHLINNTLNEHFEAKRKGSLSRSRLNNVVMQLRKNSNHPDLLVSHFDDNGKYPPIQEMLEQCGKLKLLARLLMHLKTRGHKVLIFSQMTRMLDILEFYLQEIGMNPCRIDGKVKLKDRQNQIQDFNSGNHEQFIFLLSTRAGGLGINLTAADTVIIYDSDWNPHMDLQAMDRCHRIGQDKPVHVYRLVTAKSIERKMIRVATCKMQLEHVVIERGQFKQEQYAPKTKLEEYDLLALLRHDRDIEEEYIQSSEISDADLLRVLDRTDLYSGMQDHVPSPGLSYPIKGPGWEVVTKADSSRNILTSIEA